MTNPRPDGSRSGQVPFIPDVMDNAESDYSELSPEVVNLRQIAADPHLATVERLEAFEDIIDSEVGDTILTRARNIEREYGFRQLFLKFEGNNPSGSQKDRIAFAQVMDAIRRDYHTITLATCGNFGVAAALSAAMGGIRCIIFIPENYQTKRVGEMVEQGAEIRRVPGDYEAAVMASRRFAEDADVYDANPGGANTALQLRGYGEIAYEIYDELRDAPAAVAVPVSNGTTLTGIYKGFLSLYRRGKTSRMPRIVAGSSFKKNPIVQAYLKNTPTCEDLRPESIRETRVNEPLINWHAIDGDLALSAIRHTNGWARNASDKAMSTFSRKLREKEGLHVLPASTAGLIALLDQHNADPLPNDRYVVVLTGRKS